MHEIQSLSDLEAFKHQIATQRLRIKTRPAGSFWLNSSLRRAHEAIARDNEQVYAALPQEITVSPEVGELLYNLFLDNLKVREVLEGNPKQDTLNFASRFAGAFFAPSPVTLGLLAATLAGIYKKGGDYERGMEELARRTDKTMQDVLNSYCLTKNKEGNYILKRGSWFVHEQIEWIHAGIATHGSRAFYTAIKDVGVDPNLLPEEQKCFVAQHKYEIEKSINIGR